MNIYVTIQTKAPCIEVAYAAGRMENGVETVTDADIRILVRRAINEQAEPGTTAKGYVCVGAPCHRLDAPYIFKVARGVLTDFKRRRGK